MIKYPILLERKISDLFDYHPRGLYAPQNPEETILQKDFKGDVIRERLYKKMLKVLPELPESKAFVGIEIEVEQAPKDFFHAGWREDKDGSLRNNGKEYISHVLPPEIVPKMLCGLFASLWKANPKPDFSWRTSIHIHMCVRDRTVEELLKIMLLYLTFERILFMFADQEREKSVFCVPVTKSSHALDLAHFFTQDINIGGLVQNWHKYSALNLIRLSDYGTIEFRHLSGTWDLKKVTNWVGILLSLYNSAIRMSLDEIIQEIKTLNTTSKYMLFKDTVFGKKFSKELPIPNFDLVSEGVSFCKECLSGINKIPVAEDSSMMKFVRRQEETKKERLSRDRPTPGELIKMKLAGADISEWWPSKKVQALPKKNINAAFNPNEWLVDVLKQPKQALEEEFDDSDDLDTMTEEEYLAHLKKEEAEMLKQEQAQEMQDQQKVEV